MELLAKPGVGGIIEKKINGIDYILIQERYKEDAGTEAGLIEIPAGKIRAFDKKAFYPMHVITLEKYLSKKIGPLDIYHELD